MNGRLLGESRNDPGDWWRRCVAIESWCNSITACHEETCAHMHEYRAFHQPRPQLKHEKLEIACIQQFVCAGAAIADASLQRHGMNERADWEDSICSAVPHDRREIGV